MDISVNAINPIYDVLIDNVQKRKVSDFHIHADRPIHVRESGEITALDFVATQDMVADLIKNELGAADFAEFQKSGDADFAIQIDGQRFRANAYRMMQGFAMVLRVIVTEVPHIDMLGLPPAVHDSLTLKSGLILVTGQTGSGKSTSLAAMIDKINRERNENIITIEDPIEFVHKSQQSIITQREVGRDTASFAAALKSELRQDPDIILMGELRDYETVSMAMTAAETGHLVFGTLHTNGAPETINRIIDVFPAEEQAQARSQLSQSLRLVMTQQLLKRRGGGRVGAFEVLVCVPAVANLIRESKIVQIQTIMQTGKQHGMVTMDKYIELLEAKRVIDPTS
jgi:twitching motility protein PilT